MKKLFIAISIILVTINIEAQELKNLSVKDFETGIKNTQAQLLDVRTKTEFDAGHIKNALQADYYNVKEFFERIQYLDKNKPLYVYCQAGGRSSKACEKFVELGFKDVYNLVDGYSLWISEGKAAEGVKKVTTIGMSITEYNHIINKEQTALVIVSTKWCPPCIKLKASLDSAKQEVQNVKFISIDADENPLLTKNLNVKKYPTIIKYKLGAEVWKNEGYITKDNLKKQILANGTGLK